MKKEGNAVGGTESPEKEGDLGSRITQEGGEKNMEKEGETPKNKADEKLLNEEEQEVNEEMPTKRKLIRGYCYTKEDGDNVCVRGHYRTVRTKRRTKSGRSVSRR